MAANQVDYDKAMRRLFDVLVELEERLQDKPFLFGNHITETDIRQGSCHVSNIFTVLLIFRRLFTTTVRFDMAYYTIFLCNWKMIRYDYPNMHRWLRRLYYEVDAETKGAFQSTTHFEIVSPALVSKVGKTLTS